MDAGDSEHGLSMRDPKSGRCVIAVATTAHPLRQRSSLAHELGHVLAGDLGASSDGTDIVDDAVTATDAGRTPQEIRADAFARHLLIPLDGVRDRIAPYAGSLNEAALSDLVQAFEVSPMVAAIQLKTAKLIDAATADTWMRLTTASVAARHGWLGQYQAHAAASRQVRAPQSLMRRAVEGYRRGVLGVAELAAWYGQSIPDLVVSLGAPDLLDPELDEDATSADDRPLFPPGYLTGPAGSS